MIFYENKRAEELLKCNKVISVCFEDIVILAKHFQRMGKNRPQIKKSIISFYEKNNPDFNVVRARKIINDAMNTARKYGLRFPIDVKITESEINTIRNAGNHKVQKILFTMLVLAKYSKNNNTKFEENKTDKFSDNFYTNFKITDIVKMAKVNISKKERNTVAYELQQAGLVIGIGLISYQVCFVNDDSPVSIVVTDMNSLIDFYPWYCENCGRVIENKAKRHNLCNNCYKDDLRNRKTETMRKLREQQYFVVR
jgi:hypothetical protein